MTQLGNLQGPWACQIPGSSPWSPKSGPLSFECCTKESPPWTRHWTHLFWAWKLFLSRAPCKGHQEDLPGRKRRGNPAPSLLLRAGKKMDGKKLALEFQTFAQVEWEPLTKGTRSTLSMMVHGVEPMLTYRQSVRNAAPAPTVMEDHRLWGGPPTTPSDLTLAMALSGWTMGLTQISQETAGRGTLFMGILATPPQSYPLRNKALLRVY